MSRIEHRQLPDDGDWQVDFVQRWQRQYQTANEETMGSVAMQRRAALSVYGAINEMHRGMNILAKYVENPGRHTGADYPHEQNINGLTRLIEELRGEEPPYETTYQVIRVRR